MADDSAFPPPVAAPVPPPPPPSFAVTAASPGFPVAVPDSPSARVIHWSTWAGLVAAFFAVLAAPLEWAKVQAGIFSAAKAGTEGDGVITLVLGLVLAATLIPALSRKRPSRRLVILGLVLSALVLIVGIYDTADIKNRAGELASDEFSIQFSVGVGLWLTNIAGVLGCAGAIAALADRRQVT